ncbi:MAG: TetR/AcrR family transcriptional regulator [Desulfatiglandaceae bacterium]
MTKDKNQREIEGHNARERLLDAGTTLFSEKGYASTTVREIVDHAGVTKPVLYYYFKSKEGLFRAILDGASQDQDALLSRVIQMTGTVLDRLISLYRGINHGVMENRDLFKMIHNLIFGPPQGTPEYDLDRYHQGMVTAIKTIYREGLERDEVIQADPEDVAMLILGLMDFSFHLDCVFPGSRHPGRAEELLRLTFHGLRKREEK